MREKKDFRKRIGAYLDLPLEGLPGGFSVLLSGNRALCVQGKAMILTYTDEQIGLRVGKHVLRIQGNGLFCAELTGEKLLINGTVTALFLEKEGADAT